MKSSRILIVCLHTVLSVTAAHAATIATFEGLPTDTPVTLQSFKDPIAPAGGPLIIPTGGNPGGFLRLTEQVQSQNNFAVFDRADVGASPSSTFSFQFRIGGNAIASADGFSLSFALPRYSERAVVLTRRPFRRKTRRHSAS